jgi:hypothetical protein
VVNEHFFGKRNEEIGHSGQTLINVNPDGFACQDIFLLKKVKSQITAGACDQNMNVWMSD